MDAEALGFGLGELTPWYPDARLSRDPESLLWFNWQAICSPWGKNEGLRRLPGGITTKDGGRRETRAGTDVTKRGHDRVLSLSPPLPPPLSFSLRLFYSFHLASSRDLTARDNGVTAFLPRPRESRVPTASPRRPREQRCRPDIPFVTQHRPTCAVFVNYKRCLSLTTRLRKLSSSYDSYVAHIKNYISWK